MPVLEHRIDDFMQAPVAAAFLFLAERNNLTPDDLADPATACTVASTALRKLTPWTGTARFARATALEAARSLRPLMHAVLTDERTTWWEVAWFTGADAHWCASAIQQLIAQLVERGLMAERPRTLPSMS